MLTLRFLTLAEVVDRFVVVCCSRTHQGQALDRAPIEEAFLAAGEASGARATLHWVEPSMVLERNGRTYERGPDDRGPAGTRFFAHIERQHRDGVKDAVGCITQDPEAIVCVSDVDEMPDPTFIRQIGQLTEWPARWLCLGMRMHSTYLDVLHPQSPWWGTTISRLRDLEPQAMRDARATIGTDHQTIAVIPEAITGEPALAGVHCSWFGTDAERQRKLETFSHAELAHWQPTEGRRTLTHINGEVLRKISLAESYEMWFPKPLVDGSFKIPEGWLSEDAWIE